MSSVPGGGQALSGSRRSSGYGPPGGFAVGHKGRPTQRDVSIFCGSGFTPDGLRFSRKVLQLISGFRGILGNDRDALGLGHHYRRSAL